MYGKYKKYTVKSAMVLDNLYIYFEKFAEKNEITVEDLDSAFTLRQIFKFFLNNSVLFSASIESNT